MVSPKEAEYTRRVESAKELGDIKLLSRALAWELIIEEQTNK